MNKIKDIIIKIFDIMNKDFFIYVVIFFSSFIIILNLGKGFTDFTEANISSSIGSLIVIITMIITVLISLISFFTDRSERIAEKSIQYLTRPFTVVHDKDASSKERNSLDGYLESLVNINIKNLTSYYSLVKTHSNFGFFISILTGLFGFGLVSVGVYLSYLNPEKTQYIAIVSAVSGIITEFLSGVFFYLYNKTVRQMKDYHTSLIRAQNTLLSFKILENLDDKKDKTQTVQLMIKYLMLNSTEGEIEGKNDK